jgi:alpha-glucosidase (family GH31 glycosyl hydrolase)
MFSGWVGDQDSSADGLRSAMYNVVKSAWHGYLNFGFDIGGYRGQNITKIYS